MKTKLKLELPIFGMAFIIAAVLVMTYMVTSSQRDDGKVINLAGRQRMLTQKMTKEILHYQKLLSEDLASNDKLKKSVIKTMKMFDMTLHALINSGQAPRTSFEDLVLLPKAEGDIHKQLLHVNTMWTKFSKEINDVLNEEGDEIAKTEWIMKYNIDLLKEMNKAVVMMQKSSEQKITKLLMGQVAGTVIAFFFVVGAIVTVRSVMKTLERIIENLLSNAEQVQSASKQVAHSSQQLSSAAIQQASSLEEVTASVEEMVSMTKLNADNSKQASELSQTNMETAESGRGEIKELITAMGDVSHSSKKIEEIINVIDDIAFQTNLLALNAAVEAARAGEQGKGFAVVAEAVRELAGRSSSAAKDITNLIKETVIKVDHGSKKAERSGVVLNDIVDAVKKVAGLNNEIATASSEQNQALSQISTAVNQIDQMTQGNAASSEESAASAEEMSAQSNAMFNSIGDLAKVVHGKDVNHHSHQFSQVDDGGHADTHSSVSHGHENLRKVG